MQSVRPRSSDSVSRDSFDSIALATRSRTASGVSLVSIVSSRVACVTPILTSTWGPLCFCSRTRGQVDSSQSPKRDRRRLLLDGEAADAAPREARDEVDGGLLRQSAVGVDPEPCADLAHSNEGNGEKAGDLAVEARVVGDHVRDRLGALGGDPLNPLADRRLLR